MYDWEKLSLWIHEENGIRACPKNSILFIDKQTGHDSSAFALIPKFVVLKYLKHPSAEESNSQCLIIPECISSSLHG